MIVVVMLISKNFLNPNLNNMFLMVQDTKFRILDNKRLRGMTRVLEPLEFHSKTNHNLVFTTFFTRKDLVLRYGLRHFSSGLKETDDRHNAPKY